MIKCINIQSLRPHESIIENRVEEIANIILQEGIWKHPIILDSKTKIIMDGHHRYHAARKLGFSFVPCWLLSYGEACINISSWETGELFDFNRIVEVVNKGTLYPPKTTRHVVTKKIVFQPILIEHLA